MDEDKLREIYEFANEVLDNLKPGDVEGAINWGDLGCVDVSWCKSVHGTESVMLMIEEVSPDCYTLRQYMEERMTLRFPDVTFDVQTEW